MYHEGLESMLDSASYPLSIEKFTSVIQYFEDKLGKPEDVHVGIKRPRIDDEITQESTLDRVYFLSHKNIASIYAEVYLQDKWLG